MTDPGTTPGARPSDHNFDAVDSTAGTIGGERPSDRPNRDMAAGPRPAWWRRALWAVVSGPARIVNAMLGGVR